VLVTGVEEHLRFLRFFNECPSGVDVALTNKERIVGLLIGLPVWQGYVSNSSLEDPIPGTDPSAG
jgi:hypothetical protein